MAPTPSDPFFIATERRTDEDAEDLADLILDSLGLDDEDEVPSAPR